MRFKSKMIVILILLLVFSNISLISVKAEAKNIALNCQVEASAFFEPTDGADEGPHNIVDGNIDTKWCAVAEQFDPEDLGHWIIIDFGSAKTFNKYVIKMASLCARDLGKYQYNMSDFIFEYSTDKTTWTVIDDVEGNTDEIYEKTFNPVTARYVRLSSLVPSTDGVNTIRLPEVEVYESDPNATVAPTTAAPTTAAPTTAAPTTQAPTTQAPTAQETDVPANNEASDSNLGLYIGIGAGVILVAGLVVLTILKGKKAK